MSFVEIYNEKIIDLLNLKNQNLNIREIKDKFIIENLSIFSCEKRSDLLEVFLEGLKNRRKGSHELNKDSSRSHTILTIYIYSEEYLSNG